MAETAKGLKPTAFIALGVCFMGAGIAIGAALLRSGGGEAGVALVGVGVLFLIIGAVQRRKARC